MKLYKIDHDHYDYLAVEDNQLKRLFYLSEFNDEIEFEEKRLKRLRDLQLEEEIMLDQENLFPLANSQEKQLFYDKSSDSFYMFKDDKYCSFVNQEHEIDFALEDEYLKKDLHSNLTANWNSVVKEIDDTTLFQYFNADKFREEVENSINVDKYTNSTDFFDAEKIIDTMKNYDFSKEEDKAKMIEELNSQIQQDLEKSTVEFDVKGFVRDNPDYFDLDELLRGETKAILSVYQSLEFEQDDKKFKFEATREDDLTNEVIKELQAELGLDGDDFEPGGELLMNDDLNFDEVYAEEKEKITSNGEDGKDNKVLNEKPYIYEDFELVH